MLTSEVIIFNQALNLAQEKGTIADPDENSKSANLCRTWYDTVRRRSLKAGAFPCATSYARLAVLTERDFGDAWVEGAPAPGFCFAYGVPENMLAPQYLHSFARFEQIHINGIKTICTNQPEAILRYTFDQDDVTQWDEELTLVITTFLASVICRSINGKLGLSDRLVQEANDIAMQTHTEIANQESVEFQQIPQAILARGYSGDVSPQQFYHPFQMLNGISP